MTPMIPATTALVAARPTSTALRPALRPMLQPASATSAPNVTLLMAPIANSLPATALRSSTRNALDVTSSVVTPTMYPPSRPDRATVQVKQRHHGHESDHSGQHEEIERRNPECPQGIDLLVPLHGGDVRRVGAARAPRHDDRRHDRRHFAHHGNADEIGDIYPGAELAELDRADERQNGAHQAIDDGHDDQGTRSRLLHQEQHVHGARARSASHSRRPA